MSHETTWPFIVNKIKFGSVCSGIEAASVAWHHMGWRAAWLSEIEPFPSAVLAHHYPDVPNLGDMTALPDRIRSGEVEAPDVFCGGTPCQAFSVAGLRKSLDDKRGNLSLIFCEIANEIDAVRYVRGEQPTVVFWENVSGVLSTKDNAFGCFLAGLAGEDDPLVPARGKWTNAGCVFGPKRAVAWRVLDAQYFGVAQRRRRVFVVASARDGFDPAAVLFEFDGVRRDSAPRREAGKVAPTIPSRSTAGGGLGTDFDHDGGVITMAHGHGGAEIGFDRGPTLTCNHEAPTAAYSLAHVETMPTMMAGGPSVTSHSQVSGQMRDEYIVPTTTHTLRGEGFDASEDGTGRGTPLVPVSGVKYANYSHDYAHDRITDIAGVNPALTSEAHASGNLNVLVPVGVTIHGTDPTVQKVASIDPLSQCLRARTPGNIDNSSTTVVMQPVAFQSNQSFDSGSNIDIAPTLRIGSNGQGQPPAIAFHPTQDPISSTDGSTHALGCGSSGGQASVAVAYNINFCDTGGSRPDRRNGGLYVTETDISSALTCAEHTTKIVHPTVAVAIRGREGGATAELGDEVGHCLRASSGGGDKAHVLAPVAAQQAVAFAATGQAGAGWAPPSFPTSIECSQTLDTRRAQSVMAATQVRRLTPMECERLQGFPDSYTAIPWRKKPADQCPDSPRYKALGNSWAVPNVRWIGERINAALIALDSQRDAQAS